jgi:heme exporter protein CcmD
MVFSEAIKMGSYGVYVWSCYGLTLLGLVLMAVASKHSWRIELQHAQRRAQTAKASMEPSS